MLKQAAVRDSGHEKLRQLSHRRCRGVGCDAIPEPRDTLCLICQLIGNARSARTAIATEELAVEAPGMFGLEADRAQKTLAYLIVRMEGTPALREPLVDALFTLRRRTRLLVDELYELPPARYWRHHGNRALQ